MEDSVEPWVNRSTGPRFHASRAAAWRRRVHSVTPSQIVGDRKALHRVNRTSGKTAVQPVGRAIPERQPHRAHIVNQLCDIVRRPLSRQVSPEGVSEKTK